MAGNVERRGYDVEIDSVKYRFRRGEGITGFRHQKVRSQVELQEITGITGQALQSRADVRPFVQSDWSGGSRWEKPLLTAEQDNVYVISNAMDVWRKPGFVVPMNKVNTTDHSTELGSYARPFAIYLNGRYVATLGDTATDNPPNKDVYYWDDTIDGWTIQGTFDSSTIISTAESMIYNPLDEYFYWCNTANLYSFAALHTAGNSIALPAPTDTTGVFNLLYAWGSVFFYNGETLYILNDPQGTPSWTAIASDGLGPDQVTVGSSIMGGLGDMAVATSEGILYVKNLLSGGSTQPWVYRVERDQTGAYINTPVATLPANIQAVDVAWHLGSLVIACMVNAAAYNSQQGLMQVVYYHVTQDSLGVLGTTAAEDIDESPGKLLGTVGAYLLIGGHKRVWLYDGIQGGLHPIFEEALSGSISGGPWSRFAGVAKQNADGGAWLFAGRDTTAWIEDHHTVDLNTVTNFGDDTDTYSLESAYFHFGLPFEQKTIHSVDIDTELVPASQQWTVFLEADDSGSWTQVATHTGAARATYDLSSPITGYRFRYKIAFEAKTASVTPSEFRGIKFEATSGEITDAWVLELDGTESLNLENQVIDPEDIYDSLITLADSLDEFTFKYYKPNTDTEVSATARIAQVEIEQDSENEFYARAVLVGI